MSSQKVAAISATDETTPLLAASSESPLVQANEESLVSHPSNAPPDDDTPLPWGQLLLLCFARLLEPVAFFSIFPFINQMIKDTGSLDERDVGFYSGLIESLFSLTQMMLMIQWGKASDRFGRKPVLVIALVGMSVSVSLFGFATQIWQMILFRCLAGVFAGTIVTVRAMISEISTPKTQARAFSFFAFSGNIGIFVGPLLGGAFTTPATQYPRVFGNIQFFHDYPYALSTIVVGAIGLLSALVTSLFVNETLKRKDGSSSYSTPPTSTMQLLRTPGLPMVLAIYSTVSIVALAYTAVAPVFWFTSPALGGYGLTPLQISLFLALAGASQSFWTLIVFTPLQHRVGTGGVLKICTFVWPFTFAVNPFLNQLLKHDLTTPFWVLAISTTILGAGVSQAFTATQLALNDICPTPAALGVLNAIALTIVSAIRAVCPALFASLFAFGARTQALGGYLIWLVLIIMTIITSVLTWHLPEKAYGRAGMKSSSKTKKHDDEER